MIYTTALIISTVLFIIAVVLLVRQQLYLKRLRDEMDKYNQ